MRIFRRGKCEEEMIRRDMEMIGYKFVYPNNGMCVDLGAHISGTMDAVVRNREDESQLMVVEFKTHSLDSFNELIKKKVKNSKYEHWMQMQLYMFGSRIREALYVAVCKNDDRIYSECVKFEENVAKIAVSRAHSITLSDELPDGEWNNPTWYKCKFCDGNDFCYGSRTIKPDAVNCRTCSHVTPKPDSTFYCERHEITIPVDNQRQGCNCHAIHQQLVPWVEIGSDDLWNLTFEFNNVRVLNGEDGFSSEDILRDPKGCAEYAEQNGLAGQISGIADDEIPF
jgi:hypothetical protein